MARILFAYGVGVVLGTALVLMYRQTAILNELTLLAHDQRRMTIQTIRRDMVAATAAAPKESTSDGETD